MTLIDCNTDNKLLTYSSSMLTMSLKSFWRRLHEWAVVGRVQIVGNYREKRLRMDEAMELSGFVRIFSG